jgi:hypothetical protein
MHITHSFYRTKINKYFKRYFNLMYNKNYTFKNFNCSYKKNKFSDW